MTSAKENETLWVPDCMSLVEHLNAEVPKKVQDKRLGIELAAH